MIEMRIVEGRIRAALVRLAWETIKSDVAPKNFDLKFWGLFLFFRPVRL